MQLVKDELLKGFQPTRVEKVETRRELDAKPDVAYEYEGRNAEKLWVRCEIEESGQVRKLDFLLVHPDMKRHRKERNLADLPAAVKRAAVAASPGYRFTEAFEDNPEDGFPSFTLKGVNAKGRGGGTGAGPEHRSRLGRVRHHAPSGARLRGDSVSRTCPVG